MSDLVLRTIPTPNTTFTLEGIRVKLFQGCYWRWDTNLIMTAKHDGFVVEMLEDPDNSSQWDTTHLLYQLFGGSIVTPNLVIQDGAVYCRETGEYRFDI